MKQKNRLLFTKYVSLAIVWICIEAWIMRVYVYGKPVLEDWELPVGALVAMLVHVWSLNLLNNHYNERS